MTSSVASVNDAPIGIFDSGVGGLTVARAVIDQLPHEQILYVGDTARGPYGPRSLAEVRQFALEIMDGLVARGVKMIVIACNTASSFAYETVKDFVDGKVPVINVIDPVVEHVTRSGKRRKIGVIGTKGTIKSDIYETILEIDASDAAAMVAQGAPKYK